MIPDWIGERAQMVERQLRARGIRDERVLRACREIPREEFVPLELRISSCQDEPVHIGYGQTISQPYMTALMVELLDLKGTETVLDVGSGSGYHAAVLGALAKHVYSIEIIPALAALARHNLEKTGRAGNVTVIAGDGSQGYPDAAPYDAISVAAGAPENPYKLLEQLRDPGRMVIPVGSLGDQELRVIVKSEGRVETRVASYCRFVPLRGHQGWRRNE